MKNVPYRICVLPAISEVGPLYSREVEYVIRVRIWPVLLIRPMEMLVSLGKSMRLLLETVFLGEAVSGWEGGAVAFSIHAFCVRKPQSWGAWQKSSLPVVCRYTWSEPHLYTPPSCGFLLEDERNKLNGLLEGHAYTCVFCYKYRFMVEVKGLLVCRHSCPHICECRLFWKTHLSPHQQEVLEENLSWSLTAGNKEELALTVRLCHKLQSPLELGNLFCV